MKLIFATPEGEKPRLNARLLPEQAAQIARNVDNRSGTFAPVRSPAQLTDVPNVSSPMSIFRYAPGNSAGKWLVWGNGKIVNVVPSQLADDAYHRIYWTGDGPPKMGSLSEITQGSGPYPSAHFDLGIPAPVGGTNVVPVAGRPAPTEYPTTSVRTTYVVTLVTRFGEESIPADPTVPIERWDMVAGAPAGGGVVITLPGIPGGAHDIVSKRIYRSEMSGVFQLVATVSAATSSYTDNVMSQSLGATMESGNWDAPDPRMVGLTAMDGGFMAGFFENTLCFSEAYQPHAWPHDYRIAFTDQIVGIASVTGGLIVATDGKPRIITGSSPAAMAENAIDARLPCVSRRSVVDMGEYAIYAFPRGLVAVGGGESKVITEVDMKPEQWAGYQPSAIHAYRWHDKYLAFYPGGSFTYTPGAGFEFYDIEATSGWLDAQRGELVVIQGSSIRAWNKGDKLTMRWRSKIHEKPHGLSLTRGKLIAEEYPVNLKIYGDRELFMDLIVQNRDSFRLAAGTPHFRDIEIEIGGTNEAVSLQLASAGEELV